MKNSSFYTMQLRNALVAFAILVTALPVAAANGISGRWDAAVMSGKVEIPFRFEITQTSDKVQGFFFEGDRKIGSTSGSLENGTLKLGYDFLNTTLEATLDGDQLHGTYRNNRPNARPMEFRAHRYMPPPASEAAPPTIAGDWAMYRTAPDNSKLDVSWRLYLRQSGTEVSGAILKTSGDTGTLTGTWKDGKLTMSHFAGERPILVEVQINPDDTLNLKIDGQFTYRASRMNETRAKGIPDPPDPSQFTSVKDPNEPFHFSGPTLDGKTLSDKDPLFQGKVVVLSIGGSWCPNCLDEAPMLVDFYRKYHTRGLEVVGLNFEVDPDLEATRPRVLAFTKRFGIEYPIVVPGVPEDVPAKLPQLVNFGVYPTTIFLGRDGRVRRIHAGFASLATGEAHIQLQKEMAELIEKLLAEKPQQLSSSVRTP
jgi:thiol-disulfide isomerase/thioredoxin